VTSRDPLGSLFSRIRDEVATEPEPDTAVDEAVHEPAAREPTVADEVTATVVPDRGDDAEDEFVVVAVDLVEVEPVEPEPHWPVFAVAESATLDDVALRRRRDAAIDTALKTLAPRVKRLLQDEQNELLDAVRRQRGKGDPTDAVPAEAEQVAHWTEVFRPAVDDLYAAGRVLGGGRTRPAPERLVDQLVRLLVLPLRERVVASLVAAVQAGPYDDLPELQRAVAGAVGARYREWRGQDLEAALGDLAAWAFARGIFDATPDGTLLRWVPAEVEQCPDADDNALEPTGKGRPFPTGQSCPPAHAGCRCLVVPTA
jgi:hypothetical protein